MTIRTLQERIAKAEAKVEKKQGTIEKKYNTIEKKEAQLRKHGIENWKAWSELRPWMDESKPQEQRNEEWNIYWNLCYGIEKAESDIENNKNQIAETQKTIEKYKAQLAGEIERDATFAREIPDSMKQMETELVEQWNKWDREIRAELFERRATEKDFWKHCTASQERLMEMTDEEIDRANKDSAKVFVLDLYNRIKDITGEVAEWAHIHYNKGALNGTVEGKEGTARVESILAGGYNIQRLHIRVLVHSI